MQKVMSIELKTYQNSKHSWIEEHNLLPSGTGNKNPREAAEQWQSQGARAKRGAPLYLGEISEDIGTMLLGRGVEPD